MNPFWLEDETPPRRATTLDGRVDVAIVGAGITGCSAALRLAEGGLRVRVHDARGVAEGASGRNGGFALSGGSARYDLERRSFRVVQGDDFGKYHNDNERAFGPFTTRAFRGGRPFVWITNHGNRRSDMTSK